MAVSSQCPRSRARAALRRRAAFAQFGDHEGFAGVDAVEGAREVDDRGVAAEQAACRRADDGGAGEAFDAADVDGGVVRD